MLRNLVFSFCENYDILFTEGCFTEEFRVRGGKRAVRKGFRHHGSYVGRYLNMSYPQTGKEVFISFSISNTMFSGIGKGTITREEVSVDYLKELFEKYGVIVSAKPEQRRLLEEVNESYDLQLEIPENLRIIHLSEKNRRLVVISVQGLKRENGSLLPEYTEKEFQEATFSFVKYYVQSRHYDELLAENAKLKRDLEMEVAWRTRESDI